MSSAICGNGTRRSREKRSGNALDACKTKISRAEFGTRDDANARTHLLTHTHTHTDTRAHDNENTRRTVGTKYEILII